MKPNPENENLNKSRGPKTKLVNRRCTNVTLTDAHIEKAKQLGRGNTSAGIRLALEQYKGGA